MKVKKLSLVLSTVVAGAALFALSGCSSNSSMDADIITMKGDTVQVSDLYSAAKEFPSMPTSTLLQNLTFDKIFEKESSIAKEATSKKVDAQYNKYKDQYGTQFESALQQQGFTTSNFKTYLKTQLLEQAAIEQDIAKTQYTTANLKTAWESYHPDVTAIVLTETTKDAATKAIASNKSDASKFDTDNAASKTTFNSTSTTVPTDVQTAAYKLKNGEISDVITSTSTSTGSTSYYVVKMVKTSDKGTDMNKYKSELQDVIKTEKMADTTYVSSVIAAYLKKNNVTVKESAFSSIFSQFTSTSSSSSN
ncbi:MULTISPECIES: peptidyl-prolyl cis-trans isomerase [unclassified Lactococcus]|uniref:peptidyl-prolyl cis-trans isomerase n=1 Tax=unclassified Lactococcus TaxID=2643510 RepID=UPI0011CC7CDE|nr:MULTISPECIES: peptidyl-prolyl cis-trans isomerase [unclassified Lactococcus]MQW22458.1 foldase [Lactococcus sp. dk101]TXK45486.1 foldase [Lactococcus sp. dk310]TXK51819.1 foldase [Lactococcus sp. dk322]